MILEIANRVPPLLCRLFARKKNGQAPMSHADLAKASGLSRSTVSRISYAKEWDDIPMETADRFSRACGVDLTRPAPVIKWFRRAGMMHVKTGDAQQRKFFKRLMTTQRSGA